MHTMTKGRNTTSFGVRLPDSVHARIKVLADKQGLTVSEWCRANLIRAAGLLPDGRIRDHHRHGSSGSVIRENVKGI